MNRVNAILKHPLYLDQYDRIKNHELGRPFCGHDKQHFLDVARIGYILVLEAGLQISKEEVYAYGLLHDIGRADEYEGGQDHHLASIEYAERILEDTGFTQDECRRVIEAIRNHRNKSVKNQKTFSGLMYKADKLSRACYACEAEPICNWDNQKKNRRIEI